MGLRLRSRLGNFGKISRDFGKYSSRPGFSVYNLGKITEIWSRLIFFVYCSLNLNTVIVLLPRKQREKRTRSRISRSRRDLQWTEMDMSGCYMLNKMFSKHFHVTISSYPFPSWGYEFRTAASSGCRHDVLVVVKS